MDWIVAGLGNPGLRYAHTRHNVGFDALDALAHRLHAGFFKKGFDGRYATLVASGHRILLLQPHTYMNESGRSVRAALDYYDVPTERLLVLVDDIDLQPGRIRVRGKGGAGTHNGLRSILQHLGENTFARVRIGVGTPPPPMDLVDFVLGKFPKEQRPIMKQAIENAAQAAEMVVCQGVAAAQASFNAKAEVKA